MSDARLDHVTWCEAEITRLEKENAELRAKLFKAETERGVMFEEYDKVRAKLDAWEKQSPVAYGDRLSTHWQSVVCIPETGAPDWMNRLTPLFTKPKETDNV